MSGRIIKDTGASVRERLKNLAGKQGQDFHVLLNNFALERLLYRLSISRHRNSFVLKGALLFKPWYGLSARPTMDADLLGTGSPDIFRLEKLFREICTLAAEPDGLIFRPETVKGEEIREEAEYQGVRIKLMAELAGARVPLQIDIGFGDAVTPRARISSYPVLLEFPTPRLKTYPLHTVIAEKFHAIVLKGLANSRLKDYYDLWYMSGHSKIDGSMLAGALKATFARRKTKLPSAVPEGLLGAFAGDPAKIRQWNNFTARTSPGKKTTLTKAALQIKSFIMPPVRAVLAKEAFTEKWEPGRGWK